MVTDMCNEGGRGRHPGAIKNNLAVLLLFSVFFIVFFSTIVVMPALADKPVPPSPPYTTTLVTTNTPGTSQTNVVVSGDWIVWEDQGESYRDIYAYNTATGEEVLLTPGTPDSHQAMPSVSGDKVVWIDYREDVNGDIWICDLLTGDVFPITEDSYLQRYPAISDDRVIWIDFRNGKPDIYLYDLSTGGEPQQITGVDAVPFSTAISGNTIVWEDLRVTGYEDIYLFNLLTGEEVLLTPGTESSKQRNPAVSGDYVVWEDYSGVTADIYFKDIGSTRKPASITQGTDDSDQLSPAISGDRIVWQDRRSLENTWDIYLYEISTGVDTILTPGTGDSDQMAPAISGDRVVYEDWSGEKSDIYLATIGVAVTCPDADFSANETFGNAPLTVQFTDISTGSPETWWWKFGDGSESRDQNPVHTYTEQGLYSVILTVSTPYCRDAEVRSEYITAEAGPKANFASDVTEGIAPLTVQFTDESTGAPDTWFWEFGDGGTSDEQNPVYTYQSGGVYTVSLEVSSSYGSDSITHAGSITALDVYPSTATTAFPGLSVTLSGDVQHAVFNTMVLPDFVFNATEDASILMITPPITSGFEQITLYATDGGFTWTDNTTLEGDIIRAVLRSYMMGTVGFPPEIGDAMVGFEINLSQYPADNSITVSTWENATPGDFYDFRHIVLYSQFTSLSGVAYTMLVEEDGILEGNATIRMSVNADWVEEMGGTDLIWVIRIGDDDYGEVLPTAHLSTDSGTNSATFEAESPRGLSKFGLCGLSGTGNPLQLIYLFITQPTPEPTPEATPEPTPQPTKPSSGGGGGRSGGGGGSYGGFMEYSTTPSVQAAIYYASCVLECDPSGSVTTPTTLSSPDGNARLMIPAGTTALDASGNLLSLVKIDPVAAQEIPTETAADVRVTGHAYDLQPDGATFEPPVTLAFTVSEEDWQADGGYRIEWWNCDTAEWVEVKDPVINTAEQTISAPVSHFCIYALFAEGAAPVQTAPDMSGEVESSLSSGEPQGTITGVALVRFFDVATKYPILFLIATIFLIYAVYRIKKK
jgi:beta propeller repeat protein